jgi:hypothetical protein
MNGIASGYVTARPTGSGRRPNGSGIPVMLNAPYTHKEIGEVAAKHPGRGLAECLNWPH